MLRQSKTRIARAALAAVLVGTALAGCSEHASNSIYLDRRETISPLAGDALAANRVTQTIDPWSLASAKRDIAYSGEKMQTASERYRTGRVIPPVNATTSSVSQAQQASQAAATGQATSAPSTTAVK